MKNILKFACLALLLSVTVLQAKDESSTILLSKTNVGYSLDFLNSNNDVTALQFDIEMHGAKLNKSNISSCVSGLPSSHSGSCSILKNGDLRIAIYSTTNKVLDSGNLGLFKLNTTKLSKLSINNIVMGSVDFKQVKGDAVIDIGDDKPLFDRINENK